MFGIVRLYPTLPGTDEWTSAHWSSSNYVMSGPDSHDPTGVSARRGNGTITIQNGEAVFSDNPRLYLYASNARPWRNVEFTGYYRRVGDDATAYGGFVVGARSGRDGHTTDGRCDAHTYYTRFRHDGALDFEKELMHTPGSVRNAVLPDCAWPGYGGQLPRNVWIGMKYVVYDLPNNHVALEAYRDMTGGANGGDWQLVGTAIDDGTWCVQTECSSHSPNAIGRSNMVVRAGGAFLIRNTNVSEARYRWFSLREIVPPAAPPATGYTPQCYRSVDSKSLCQ